MKSTASFQSFPSGYWLIAGFTKGKLTFSHKYTIVDELVLHQENIRNVSKVTREQRNGVRIIVEYPLKTNMNVKNG